MLTLGIDSSGKTASAALMEDGVVLSEYSANIGLTHSQTLLPMVAEIFSRTGRKPEELSLIAVSAGPGSFTGLRIGAATGKGIALAYRIPMAEISTLEGLAFNVRECEAHIHPIMDARRNQVYTAEFADGKLIGEEEAISVETLTERINQAGGRHLFLGDAVPVYKEYLEAHLKVQHAYAGPGNSLQRAASVAALGEKAMRAGRTVLSDAFRLSYIRVPQAERERAAEGLREYDILHDPAEIRHTQEEDKLKATNHVKDIRS